MATSCGSPTPGTLNSQRKVSVRTWTGSHHEPRGRQKQQNYAEQDHKAKLHCNDTTTNAQGNLLLIIIIDNLIVITCSQGILGKIPEHTIVYIGLCNLTSFGFKTKILGFLCHRTSGTQGKFATFTPNSIMPQKYSTIIKPHIKEYCDIFRNGL